MRVVVDMLGDAVHGQLAASGFEPRPFLPGGEQNMYELAFAAASLGYETELRGWIEADAFARMREATDVAPAVELPARRPAADDLVIVPEGWQDPAEYATLRLSPARMALFVLAAPGLFGWPFVEADWARPDPLTVDLQALARGRHFQAMAACGFALLTHSPGIADAARAAGVGCALVGIGRPSMPDPPAAATRPTDAALLLANRWEPLAEQVAAELPDLVIDRIPESSNREILARLARAKVLLWPSRIEGHATIPWEARTVGCVPVALSSNRFAIGLDEPSGSIVVDDVAALAPAVRALLGDPDRLHELSARAQARSREEVAWPRYVERVRGFLQSIESDQDSQAGAQTRAGAEAWAAMGTALIEAHERAATRAQELAAELGRVVVDRDELFAQRNAIAAERETAVSDREYFRTRLEQTQAQLNALMRRPAVRATLKLDGIRERRHRREAATSSAATDRWPTYLAEVEPALAAEVRLHRFAATPVLADSSTRAAPLAVWIDGDGPAAERTVAALAQSTLAPAAMLEGDDLNAALSSTRAEHVVLVRAGDRLAPLALERLGQAVTLAPDARVITCDEDALTSGEERHSPHFRPGPSPDRWLACDDSGSLLVVARGAALDGVAALGDAPGARHALALTLAGSGGEHHAHVPLLLAHRDDRGGAMPGGDPATIAATLAGWEPGASITTTGAVRRVSRPLIGEPHVQVIVCLRDQAQLTARCVDSMLIGTAYDRFSLTLVDNGSVEPATASLLDRLRTDPRVDVRRDDRPFNFAALNHAAVDVAADLLVFLNNDTEVVDPDWMTTLAQEAQRPQVGAVAPMLLYPDRTVQHAGAALGLHGYAGHPFAGLAPEAPTPFGYAAQGTRNWLAVSAACMMVSRDAYLEVGGFDERFVVAGNDVDLCLRLTAAGHRSLCVPHAVLLHDESRSRGGHIDPGDFAASQASYGLYRTVGDPFYNPSLSLRATDCRVRTPTEDM